MNEEERPFEELVSIVRGFTNLQYKEIAYCIEEGYMVLAKTKVSPTGYDYRNISICRGYDRVMREYRKLTIKDIIQDHDILSRFNMHCEMLLEGLKQTNINKNQLDKEIKSYQNQVNKYIGRVPGIEVKLCIEEDIDMEFDNVTMVENSTTIKIGETNNKYVELLNLYDCAYGLLCDTSVSTIDDFNDLEELEYENYDKYIIAEKQEEFILKGESTELAIKILGCALKKVAYVISITSDENLKIDQYDSIEDAVERVLLYINDKNNEIVLSNVESKENNFETKLTFMEKVSRLLS